ncbi:hypothetical protein JW906_08945 [bacterium]|nr:hypothetical protein [bacterium]
MAKTDFLDKKAVLASLEVDAKSVTESEEFTLEQMNITSSVLKLADINQEKEYELCRRAAEHLLEKVPEPEKIDIE